jgi:hypothetical protein
MSDDLVEEVCNTILEWVGDVIDHEHAMSVARAAIACVQQHFDLPPTKSEMDLRLELGRTQAEVVHTQDELGALLHAAEAKLAEVQRWRPISEAPKDRPIEAWHKVWKCAVTIVYRSWGDRSAWVEKTLTTEWPLEAFTHWREAPLGREDDYN